MQRSGKIIKGLSIILAAIGLTGTYFAYQAYHEFVNTDRLKATFAKADIHFIYTDMTVERKAGIRYDCLTRNLACKQDADCTRLQKHDAYWFPLHYAMDDPKLLSSSTGYTAETYRTILSTQSDELDEGIFVSNHTLKKLLIKMQLIGQYDAVYPEITTAADRLYIPVITGRRGYFYDVRIIEPSGWIITIQTLFEFPEDAIDLALQIETDCPVEYTYSQRSEYEKHQKELTLESLHKMEEMQKRSGKTD